MVDAIDIKILNIMQGRARIKRSALADAVGLSLPALSERLNKLEGRGVIEGYFTKVKKKVFNYDIMAIIQVFMDSSKYYGALSKNVQKSPEILECYSVLGEGSHILRAIVKETEELEKLLSKIQSWPGVNHTVTNFVLSTIKETTIINLEGNLNE